MRKIVYLHLLMFLYSCASNRGAVPVRGPSSAPSINLDEVECRENGSFSQWTVKNPSIEYSLTLLNDVYYIAIPWNTKHHASRVRKCFDQLSTYMIGPSEFNVKFVLLENANMKQVDLDLATSDCREISSILIWELGLADSMVDALEYYDRINYLPRFLLESCTCSQLDQGSMTYGACLSSLKDNDSCPVTSFKSERVFTWKDFPNYDAFAKEYCELGEGKYKRSLVNTKYSKKYFCSEIHRSQSILRQGDFEKIVPPTCPGIQD